MRLEEADNHDNEAGHFLNDSRSVLEGIGGLVPDEVPEVEAPDGGGLINIRFGLGLGFGFGFGLGSGLGSRLGLGLGLG